MKVYRDEYGIHRSYHGVILHITSVTDKLGLYLEGFKITGDVSVYSYRRRKMVFLHNGGLVNILETQERCNVIRWIKEEMGGSVVLPSLLEHVLTKTFHCTFKNDFWRLARIVWIGHYKEPRGILNMLPRDMVRVVLGILCAKMAKDHRLL